MLHDNSRENKGYVAFITSILDRTVHQWKVLHHIDDPTAGAADCTPQVLDWGAGPEPVATELLRERGYEVQPYDPLFGPPLPSENHLFDIILCIEVAEHFKNPAADFEIMARYLKPGGLLAVHTHTIPKGLFAAKEHTLTNYFVPWWYKEDPTHVSFYSETSLGLLAFISGLSYEPSEGTDSENLHFFVKPLPVLVVGGANVDIEGRPFGPLKDRDSNPGRVRFSRGGAGRNVAENLARLNMPVQFISVFGNDSLSRLLRDETKATGVDLDGILITENSSPSCYLSILDETGDMKLALSSMESLNLLTPDALGHCLSALSSQDNAEKKASEAGNHPKASPSFSMIVADGNLMPETIETLLDRLPGIPAWFDPVSTAKAQRFAAYKDGTLLKRFYGLKPNKDELFALAETLDWKWPGAISSTFREFIERVRQEEVGCQDFTALAKILMASQFLLNKGCQELHVSLGTEGIILMKGSSVLWGKPPVLSMTSATGAGDSYLAAVVRCNCLDPVAARPDLVVAYGCASSAITLKDQDAVSQHMSPLALYRLLKTWKLNKNFVTRGFFKTQTSLEIGSIYNYRSVYAQGTKIS